MAELTQQQAELAKPREVRRQELERQVGIVEESLEEIRKNLRNKAGQKGKDVLKKEWERKDLVEEKKGLEEKRKEVKEKLASLQAKKATPQPTMQIGDVSQKLSSFKRKLKPTEKPRDLDPYAFDELDDLGAQSKPPKDTRKNVSTTPQKKKVPTTPKTKKVLTAGPAVPSTPFSGDWKRKLAGSGPKTPVSASSANKFDDLLQFSSPELSSP